MLLVLLMVKKLLEHFMQNNCKKEIRKIGLEKAIKSWFIMLKLIYLIMEQKPK